MHAAIPLGISSAFPQQREYTSANRGALPTPAFHDWPSPRPVYPMGRFVPRFDIDARSKPEGEKVDGSVEDSRGRPNGRRRKRITRKKPRLEFFGRCVDIGIIVVRDGILGLPMRSVTADASNYSRGSISSIEDRALSRPKFRDAATRISKRRVDPPIRRWKDVDAFEQWIQISNNYFAERS